jgi:LmbE family N-acetylglucosaminyl deacetylase
MWIKSIIRRVHLSWLEKHCTFAQPLTLKGSVAIIAPHPDDEVIGCGGLIARLVSEGRAPQIIVMTGGGGSHAGCCSTKAETIVEARRGLTRRALTILGVPEDHLHELNFPDGGISSACAEVSRLRALLESLRPGTVLVPHWGEGWPDHLRTAEMVKDLCGERTHVVEYCVWMWYYNVWRRLDWKRAAGIVLSEEEHEKKLRAMDAYVTPLAPCGKPWSGVLPELFLKAHRGGKELYFKVR